MAASPTAASRKLRSPALLGRPRWIVVTALLSAGSLLASCGAGQPTSGSATTDPSTTARSAPTTAATLVDPAAEAFSNVNWSEIVLPGQSGIPAPPLQKAGCAMQLLSQILSTSETRYVAYLSPSPGVNLAVLAAACSAYNINAVTLFVYKANGTPQPTLLEVAYDGWFSNPADLTATVPIASSSAGGWHGYFLYRAMRILGGGRGLAVGGVTFGPQGPTTPLSSAKMVPAEITFAWNGSFLVFASAKNLATPTIRL